MTKTFTTSHLIYSVLICLHEKDTQTSAVVGVRYIWKKICDMKQNDKNIINRKTIFVKYNKSWKFKEYSGRIYKRYIARIGFI